MSFNFDSFTSQALNCTTKGAYLLLVAFEPSVRSDCSESGAKFEKYHFVPVNNDDQQYDSVSICFCSECELTISDDSEPCEVCFPHDDDYDDYDDL